jgi:hypothetical protein
MTRLPSAFVMSAGVLLWVALLVSWSSTNLAISLPDEGKWQYYLRKRERGKKKKREKKDESM